MNELFQNFDIVISDNNMDIRNFLVLFASGTAGHETKHWTQKKWPLRTRLVPGSNNKK
jgi:hypothetical protein